MTEPPPPPETDQGEPAPSEPPPPPVEATRAGRVWVALILGLVPLTVLLVFIFQNLQETTVNFFGFSGSLSVALALLLAAVGGALVVFLVGSVRIIQLRRGVRRSFAKGAEHSRRQAVEPPSAPAAEDATGRQEAE